MRARCLRRLQTQGAKEDVGGGGAENPADEYAWQTASGLHCSGRIVLNVWRLMRTGGWAAGPRAQGQGCLAGLGLRAVLKVRHHRSGAQASRPCKFVA